MTKPTKKTVYLPVPDFKTSKLWVSDKETEQLQFVKEEQGHFFTSEQLNEYTQNVIKQTLETAAENGYREFEKQDKSYSDSIYFDKQSITNTFEETFKLFKHE